MRLLHPRLPPSWCHHGFKSVSEFWLCRAHFRNSPSIFNNEKKNEEEEIAWLVKYLTCRHEDSSSDTCHPHRKLDVASHIHSAGSGMVQTQEISWSSLANWSTLMSGLQVHCDPFSKIRWREMRDTQCWPLAFLCMHTFPTASFRAMPVLPARLWGPQKRLEPGEPDRRFTHLCDVP